MSEVFVVHCDDVHCIEVYDTLDNAKASIALTYASLPGIRIEHSKPAGRIVRVTVTGNGEPVHWRITRCKVYNRPEQL